MQTTVPRSIRAPITKHAVKKGRKRPAEQDYAENSQPLLSRCSENSLLNAPTPTLPAENWEATCFCLEASFPRCTLYSIVRGEGGAGEKPISKRRSIVCRSGSRGIGVGQWRRSKIAEVAARSILLQPPAANCSLFREYHEIRALCISVYWWWVYTHTHTRARARAQVFSCSALTARVLLTRV